MARVGFTMRNIIKDTLSYALLIGCAGFFLLVFILLFIYEDLWVGEPNKVIVALEITLCLGMLTLGIERIHHLIRRNRK